MRCGDRILLYRTNEVPIGRSRIGRQTLTTFSDTDIGRPCRPPSQIDGPRVEFLLSNHRKSITMPIPIALR